MRIKKNNFNNYSKNNNYQLRILSYMFDKTKEFEIFDPKMMEDEYYSKSNGELYSDKEKIQMELHQIKKYILYTSSPKFNIEKYNQICKDYIKMLESDEQEEKDLEKIKTDITFLQVDLCMIPKFYTTYNNYLNYIQFGKFIDVKKAHKKLR